MNVVENVFWWIVSLALLAGGLWVMYRVGKWWLTAAFRTGENIRKVARTAVLDAEDRLNARDEQL